MSAPQSPLDGICEGSHMLPATLPIFDATQAATEAATLRITLNALQIPVAVLHADGNVWVSNASFSRTCLRPRGTDSGFDSLVPSLSCRQLLRQSIKKLCDPEFTEERIQLELVMDGERSTPYRVALRRLDLPAAGLKVMLEVIELAQEAAPDLTDSPVANKPISLPAECRHRIEIENLYANVPIGLAIVDQELRCVRVNEVLAELNGVSVENHIGQTVRQIVPKMADRLEPIYRYVLSSGESVLNVELSGETRARPGYSRHWLANYHPVRRPDGTVIAVNAVVQDITARKLAEERLRISNRRLAAVLDTAADGIITLDPTGRIQRFNPAAEQIFGYEHDEAVGMDFKKIGRVHV